MYFFGCFYIKENKYWVYVVNRGIKLIGSDVKSRGGLLVSRV